MAGSVQYQILDDKIYDAFYKLSAPQKQIESFVFNSILGHVPKLTLDQTFEQQSGISVAVKVELDTIMSGFGFNILTALVTDIVPDVKVKDAMNDINAAQRAQVAAQARGEAEKILKVKQAEAEAESKALQGKGIAAERQAIIDGLRASIENFREAVPGSTAEDVMALVLLTQYFDTLKANDFMMQILAGPTWQHSQQHQLTHHASPPTTRHRLADKPVLKVHAVRRRSLTKKLRPLANCVLPMTALL